MSKLSSDLMSSRPDWLSFTIVTKYGFTQTFEGKQSQSLLSNSYGNFVLGTPSKLIYCERHVFTCQTVDKSATIICVNGAKMLLSERVNFEF